MFIIFFWEAWLGDSILLVRVDSDVSQPRRKHNKQLPAARHTTVIKVSLQRIPQDLKMCLDDEELDTDEKCTICLSMLEDGEDVRYTYMLNCFFIEKECWFCRCEHKLCKQFVVSLGHVLPFLFMVTAFINSEVPVHQRQSVIHFAGCFNTDWNITIELIAMKFCTDIHGPQRVNHADLSLRASSRLTFVVLSEILD